MILEDKRIGYAVEGTEYVSVLPDTKVCLSILIVSEVSLLALSNPEFLLVPVFFLEFVPVFGYLDE